MGLTAAVAVEEPPAYTVGDSTEAGSVLEPHAAAESCRERRRRKWGRRRRRLRGAVLPDLRLPRQRKDSYEDAAVELGKVPRRELQLVGVAAAMIIACKYEEVWAPEVKDALWSGRLVEVLNSASPLRNPVLVLCWPWPLAPRRTVVGSAKGLIDSVALLRGESIIQSKVKEED